MAWPDMDSSKAFRSCLALCGVDAAIGVPPSAVPSLICMRKAIAGIGSPAVSGAAVCSSAHAATSQHLFVIAAALPHIATEQLGCRRVQLLRIAQRT